MVAACTDTGASRIVVAPTGLDHFTACRDALAGAGDAVEGCQLTVTRLVQPERGASRLVGSSPVLLLTGTR